MKVILMKDYYECKAGEIYWDLGATHWGRNIAPMTTANNQVMSNIQDKDEFYSVPARHMKAFLEGIISVEGSDTAVTEERLGEIQAAASKRLAAQESQVESLNELQDKLHGAL